MCPKLLSRDDGSPTEGKKKILFLVLPLVALGVGLYKQKDTEIQRKEGQILPTVAPRSSIAALECVPAAIHEFPPDLFTQEQRRGGWVALHFLATAYLCVVLAIVCDQFFVPTLEIIAESLNVPVDVAGATFMAIGTSSPELYSAVIGSFVTKGDIGIGTIVGSAVFNILGVTSVTGIFLWNTETSVDWFPISRDCLVYIFSVTTLICIIQDNVVTSVESVLLLMMFAVYIAVMYFNSSIKEWGEGTLIMMFSSWSWWLKSFHPYPYLAVGVLLFYLPLCSEAILASPACKVLLFSAAICATLWLWITRYRLKYLLRTCLLSLLLLNLIQMMLPSPQDSLDILQSVLITVTVAMMFVRIFWSNPTEIKRKPLDQSEDCRSKGRVRKRGDPNKLPPVFPNGWIPIAQSSDIPKEGVLPVSVLGQKLVAFRGSSGQVFVLDAYCPHLGADLGEKGRVEGDCIKCPFHGWRFRGEDGMCSHIPNSNTIPSVAKVSPWHCVERNAFVFVWHHAEGEEPSWEIPAVPQVESGLWKYRGKTEHVAYCHMQEIPENGADVAHLYQLHSRSVFSGEEWMSDPGWFEKFIDHEWTPDWRPDEDCAHVGRMTLSQRCLVRFFSASVALPLSNIDMEIKQIGPAVVQMHLRTAFGDGVFLQHVIPEGPLQMRVVHLLFTESRFVQIFAKLLIYAEAYMFDRDVAVWNHKRLLRNPVLVREDRLIARYRRWYTQFYSDNSPTLREVIDRSLDW